MNVNLKNKIALVTGTSRGIGRRISLAIANSGALVILAARTENKLKKVEGEIISLNGRAITIPTDLSKERDILSLFQQIKKKYGKLDILINNAGIGSFAKLVDFNINDFDKLITHFPQVRAAISHPSYAGFVPAGQSSTTNKLRGKRRRAMICA